MARLSHLLAVLCSAAVAVAAPTPQMSTGKVDVGALDNLIDGVSDMVRALVSNPNAKQVIPHRYIVAYNKTYDDDAINAKEAWFTGEIKKRNLGKRGLHGKMLSTTMHSFRLGGDSISSRGFALDADDDMIQEIYNSKEVAYVEAVSRVHMNDFIAQVNAPPGLDRLSHKSSKAADTYVFDDSAGEGITVYVLDTGIKTSHVEYEGRATFGANFVDKVNDDENGHGSHVAGTIGGATFGVAKKVNLVAVKVLGADGGGDNSGVLQGMQWIKSDVEKKGIKGKAVMNMSLGGSKSQFINDAIEALFDAGVVPVVAAGNEAVDAGLTSPGSADKAITVGAINDKDDTRATFSNFGTKVDIYAPGVNILSVGIKSNTDTATLQGTSMASPHVAGLAAYLMRFESLTSPNDVQNRIKAIAKSAGASVVNNVQGTTSLIANNGNSFQ